MTSSKLLPKIADITKKAVKGILANNKLAQNLVNKASTAVNLLQKNPTDVVKGKIKNLAKNEFNVAKDKNLGKNVGKTVAGKTGLIKKYHDTAIKMEHVFSAKHKKRGIMKLGKTEEEIISSFKNIVAKIDAKGLLKEGTNQIKTQLNNFDIEIKVHIIDGIVRSFDGYVGHSSRAWANSITWP